MSKKVLIACEESQAVCIEFRKLGIEAYSCDIQDCSGGPPEWHIKGDVLEQLDKGWDMMISFPPCTLLAVSGAGWFEEKRKDGRQQQGIDFFMAMVNAPIEKIAIENPVGIMSNIYREPDCIIQPYRFGDPFQKTTCLWLKNLPILKATHHDAPLFGETIDKGEFYEFTSKKGVKKRQPLWFAEARGFNGKKQTEDSGKIRSKTFPGIAKEMAQQWSKVL